MTRKRGNGNKNNRKKFSGCRKLALQLDIPRIICLIITQPASFSFAHCLHCILESLVQLLIPMKQFHLFQDFLKSNRTLIFLNSCIKHFRSLNYSTRDLKYLMLASIKTCSYMANKSFLFVCFFSFGCYFFLLLVAALLIKCHLGQPYIVRIILMISSVKAR